MPEQPLTGRLLRRGSVVLWRQVALHPIPFVIAVVGALGYALATIGQSWVLGQVVDRVITPRFASGDLVIGSMVAGAAVVVGVGLAKTAGVICRRVAATIATARVGATLRERMAEQYHRLPLSWHHRHPAGELLSHAEGDVLASNELLAPLPFATGVAALLLVSTTWLVLTDPYLAAVGLAMVPATIGINLLYQRRVERWTTLAQQRLGEMAAVAHESFDGALVVKALGAEEAEGRRFAAGSERLRDARVAAARTRATFDSALDAIPALVTMVLLVLGTWRIQQGAITAGTLVALVNLFALMAWPLRLITYVLGDMPPAVAGHDRIRRVLEESRGEAPAAAARATVPAIPTVPAALGLEVDGVGFAYPEGGEVLHNVSFRVQAGRTVALVGPTGCGKSTLAMLLGRVLVPGRGTIRVDGRDLLDLPDDEVPRVVALAFQEPFLFSASIDDNIRLDDAAVTRQAARQAARLAQVEEFARRLPDGYDTVVGERGATLSGGQRQRVALARALARRPRLLVLDEATSSVDPVTEAAILGGLSRALPGTTTVIVASRLATIALADRVLYLEAGRLLAEGSHHELLAEVPGYARLARAYQLAEAAGDEVPA